MKQKDLPSASKLMALTILNDVISIADLELTKYIEKKLFDRLKIFAEHQKGVQFTVADVKNRGESIFMKSDPDARSASKFHAGLLGSIEHWSLQYSGNPTENARLLPFNNLHKQLQRCGIKFPSYFDKLKQKEYDKNKKKRNEETKQSNGEQMYQTYHAGQQQPQPKRSSSQPKMNAEQKRKLKEDSKQLEKYVRSAREGVRVGTKYLQTLEDQGYQFEPAEILEVEEKLKVSIDHALKAVQLLTTELSKHLKESEAVLDKILGYQDKLQKILEQLQTFTVDLKHMMKEEEKKIEQVKSNKKSEGSYYEEEEVEEEQEEEIEEKKEEDPQTQNDLWANIDMLGLDQVHDKFEFGTQAIPKDVFGGVDFGFHQQEQKEQVNNAPFEFGLPAAVQPVDFNFQIEPAQKIDDPFADCDVYSSPPQNSSQDFNFGNQLLSLDVQVPSQQVKQFQTEIEKEPIQLQLVQHQDSIVDIWGNDDQSEMQSIRDLNPFDGNKPSIDIPNENQQVNELQERLANLEKMLIHEQNARQQLEKQLEEKYNENHQLKCKVEQLTDEISKLRQDSDSKKKLVIPASKIMKSHISPMNNKASLIKQHARQSPSPIFKEHSNLIATKKVPFADLETVQKFYKQGLFTDQCDLLETDRICIHIVKQRQGFSFSINLNVKNTGQQTIENIQIVSKKQCLQVIDKKPSLQTGESSDFSLTINTNFLVKDGFEFTLQSNTNVQSLRLPICISSFLDKTQLGSDQFQQKWDYCLYQESKQFDLALNRIQNMTALKLVLAQNNRLQLIKEGSQRNQARVAGFNNLLGMVLIEVWIMGGGKGCSLEVKGSTEWVVQEVTENTLNMIRA